MLVRADTRIELRLDRRLDGSVHLLGTLRDDLGATVAGVPIDVSAWRETASPDGARPRWTAHPRTDARGSFDVVFAPEDGWWASAAFAGTDLYLATEARQRLDLRLAHVSLTVHVDGAGMLDLDRPDHTVWVHTESAAGGADLSVSLRNELGAALAEGRTDASGNVVLTVPSALLGPPSAGRLVALSAADAVRSAAQAEVPIVRLRPTRLALELASRTEETVRLTGALTDSTGARPGDAIGLYAGDRHLATAATDEAGRFAEEIPLDALSGLGGEVAIVARFSSDAPWVGASESAPVRVSFRPALWDTTAIVSAISIALALLALAALTRGRSAVAEAPAAEPGKSALVLGTRGRARHTTVSGTIEDVRTGERLAGARVAIGTAILTAGPDGRFECEPPADATSMTIEVEGYEAFRSSLSLPHRGEHHGMRARMVSLRDLALAPLRPIALRLLPSGELWSLWTQRELLAALRKAGREPPELGVLIDRVERACYGAGTPDAEQIAAIRELAARIEPHVPSRDVPKP